MADLRHLYQDTLLEHYRAPRHAEPLPSPDAHASRNNPRCGDACEASLAFEDARIAKISVISRGCTIAVASGSILAELCEGLTRKDALALLGRAGAIIRGDAEVAHDDRDALAALATLRDYPTRHQCALLARDALEQALSSARQC